MLTSEFSELFEQTRRYSIGDSITQNLIEEFELEYGYTPRNLSELMEVLE